MTFNLRYDCEDEAQGQDLGIGIVGRRNSIIHLDNMHAVSGDIHGVLTTLTAITNLPRAGTSSLASSEMTFAASRSAHSASGKASIFTTLLPLPPRTLSFPRN